MEEDPIEIARFLFTNNEMMGYIEVDKRYKAKIENLRIPDLLNG